MIFLHPKIGLLIDLILVERRRAADFKGGGAFQRGALVGSSGRTRQGRRGGWTVRSLSISRRPGKGVLVQGERHLARRRRVAGAGLREQWQHGRGGVLGGRGLVLIGRSKGRRLLRHLGDRGWIDHVTGDSSRRSRSSDSLVLS